ncbi:sigma-70 family RNA polymerase sigma factor [Engelhardtia mirabilis]|uniref:RNA polymerase sigma-D factor n=1 Tax=Engelhardtia mirabilis TaxID=2528011 RepID=A0A518BSP9_9BACT|nr:RNA polymerase sigma-D factor [Planctomycetes bacterium Pla133]QDV04325.1 RNA polymerase sigma-D factor [Planctomycetes bacterium Pla86]
MTPYQQASQLDPGAREALILEHLPLLHHIVGRLAVELPARIDRDDLLGYGMLGLIAAADGFDPGRGLQFSTYAFPRIRGAIIDELRKADFLPRGRRERVRDLDTARRGLEQSLGRPPSPEELAGALEISEEEVDQILSSARTSMVVSLDDGPTEDFGALLADPRSEDPVDSAEWVEMKRVLARAIGELPDNEQTVISLYYAEGLLLKEIGEVLGVTESRVSQLHSRAVYRLNVSLRTDLGEG